MLPELVEALIIMVPSSAEQRDDGPNGVPSSAKVSINAKGYSSVRPNGNQGCWRIE
jgi:hypothetical protein